MADAPKPQDDTEKFAPQNVKADPKANQDHHAEFHGRDLPRGSETATRDHARNN